MPRFIQDSLEIKFLILYLAARLEAPVPFMTLMELSLCDDGVGYFDFAACLTHLTETGHIAQTPEGLYAITEKGRRNGAVCESELPKTIRIKCDANLAECNRRLRREKQVRSRWKKRPNGTYTLSLALDDDMGSLFDLKLMVPREDMAEVLAKHFQDAPEQVYHRLLSILLESYRESQRREASAGNPPAGSEEANAGENTKWTGKGNTKRKGSGKGNTNGGTAGQS